MNTAIGHTFLYNIIIIFILIVFAFIAATLSYYKSFKVNNNIIFTIEKFEGYNDLSLPEINQKLGSMGYSTDRRINCPETYDGMTLVSFEEEVYEYCVYYERQYLLGREYFHYGILTYMTMDLPLVNMFKLPVFTRTNQIYKFTTTQTDVTIYE